MINKVILVGHVGKDPEFRVLDGGYKVARFSLATNKSFKSGDEWKQKTEWHNVVVWRDRAEYVRDKVKKGNLIYIEGEVQYRENDGKYYTDINCSVLRKLDKSDGNGSNFPENPPEDLKTAKEKEFEDAQNGEDDLPF